MHTTIIADTEFSSFILRGPSGMIAMKYLTEWVKKQTSEDFNGVNNQIFIMQAIKESSDIEQEKKEALKTIVETLRQGQVQYANWVSENKVEEKSQEEIKALLPEIAEHQAKLNQLNESVELIITDIVMSNPHIMEDAKMLATTPDESKIENDIRLVELRQKGLELAITSLGKPKEVLEQFSEDDALHFVNEVIMEKGNRLEWLSSFFVYTPDSKLSEGDTTTTLESTQASPSEATSTLVLSPTSDAKDYQTGLTQPQ